MLANHHVTNDQLVERSVALVCNAELDLTHFQLSVPADKTHTACLQY